MQATIDSIAPGAVGDLLTEALQQGSTAASRESGETALVGGFIAAVFAGMSAMAQIERGANRIYGVERDRPFVRKYIDRARAGAVSAGLLALLSFIVLVGGSAIRDAAGWSDGFDSFWASRAGRSGCCSSSHRCRSCSSSARGAGSPRRRGSRSARASPSCCGWCSWAC